MNTTILVRPYITEKTMQLATRNWYSFVVFTNANKAEIASAVKKMYNVTVLDVRTVTAHGKMKRAGKRQKVVKRPDWKKAMVRIKSGQTIDAFQIGEQEKK